MASLLLGMIGVFENQEDQVASAQPEVLLAQSSEDEALDTFFNSQYDYFDASILAGFFGSSLQDAKVVIGSKILLGPTGKSLLTQRLTDARISALNSVEDLRYWVDAGYTYEDAEALAAFWGDSSPYEAKLRIERNLILDQKEAVDTALLLAAN
jgi:hypothetical protein